MIQQRKICIVSGHYPKVVLFAELTRNILREYAKTHQYSLYYDSETPVPKGIPELHFRRCLLLKKASEAFPYAEWYIWLDTDIYIQAMERRIEEFIDLSDPTILYHVFNEKPWGFPVNTGVKLVNRKAIHWEDEIYALRENCAFPYEQKLVIDYIVPKYGSQVLIHDPYTMNCLYGEHDHKAALFVHVCSRSSVNRNLIILSNTRKLLKNNQKIILNRYYQNFHYFYFKNYILKVIQAANSLFKKLISESLPRN
ncbi:hypothetical protein [Algoriphagus aquimarinus]|uniref:Galactosyl transferase GMA12/MNN10 family protein n=1 Tax=Algoriphagus aquimarinus TaxID=237018 RepID=A0A5C7ARS1_9BACT|nr:hypothetical protein [Algoriphagus aquimarinus]TXE11418.1 hypothetical protein ESV85_10880 [Algoriphagus aquimarinus]